jgi:hypothetical protein
MIVGEEFRNVIENGQVTGFQIGVRMPYFASVYLSLVGRTVLTVDGEQFSPEQMKVTIGGKTYPHTQLEDYPNDKWEFGEIGFITVLKPGGLRPGEHAIDLRQHLKISYMPGGLDGHDAKVLILQG